MTLNLIETLKTSIDSPKHTINTKIHFKYFKKVKNPYFSKMLSSKKKINVLFCF